jgi:hypothetical protein
MEGEDLQELVKKQAETIELLQARIVELEAVIARLQKIPQFIQAAFFRYCKT